MESIYESALIAKINAFIKLADSFTSLKSVSNNNEAAWNEILRRPITDGGHSADLMEREIQGLRKDLAIYRKPLEDCGEDIALQMEKSGLDSTIVFTTLQKSRICLSDYVDWWRYIGKPQMRRLVAQLIASSETEKTDSISKVEKGIDAKLPQVPREHANNEETKNSVTILNRDQLALLIRQQVKAEAKSSLNDDVLVAAYRQFGSMRKAAESLSKETGQQFSKDQVQRAVLRAGGVQTVLRTESSDSVQRTVASQSRDRKMKFASPTQPLEMD